MRDKGYVIKLPNVICARNTYPVDYVDESIGSHKVTLHNIGRNNKLVIS